MGCAFSVPLVIRTSVDLGLTTGWSVITLRREALEEWL